MVQFLPIFMRNLLIMSNYIESAIYYIESAIYYIVNIVYCIENTIYYIELLHRTT